MTSAATLVPPSVEHRAAGPSDGLLRLPGGSWGLWRTFCVRAAGFPVTDVRKLGSPDAARLAVRSVVNHTPEARRTFCSTFAAERRRIRGALRDLVCGDRFREAVLWQNHVAFRNSVLPVALADPDCIDSDLRKKVLLAASYVQRYAAKNDTIGFFGPVGWGRFSDQAVPATVTCGESLIASRDVYFESWAVDAIARTFDSQPDLRDWRVPRVPAPNRLNGTEVMVGSRPALRLSDAQARLFEACDGARNAHEIARAVCAADAAAFPAEAAVLDVLEAWHRAGYIVWSFEGPRELHPERRLRGRLERITDPQRRERALGDLAQFEALKHTVGTAASPEALERALTTLESSFARVTGVAGTRAPGQMYAARTLVYLDCRRDAFVQLGADVLQRLGPALTIVLDSTRWAVYELARRHSLEFRQVFDALSAGRRAVPLASFVPRTSLSGDAGPGLSKIAAAVRSELQRRWSRVLQPPPAARRIAFRSRDLRDLVRAEFAVAGPPPSSWAASISPDIMIDAPGADAIGRGQYQIVLGEIHPYNTVPQSVFLSQCPNAAEVMDAIDRETPAPRIHWSAPKDAAPQRVQYALKQNDYVYVSSREPSPVPPMRTLRVSDLAVVDSGEGLFVEGRDGFRCSCDEFFGYLVMRRATDLVSLLPTGPHRPRITIDDVVVCREQWRVPVAEVPFVTRGDELDRFADCQRWAYGRGIPRYVFTRLPAERKPVYLDLYSPLFVDLFARSARTLARSQPDASITLTEMLPQPSGVWFPDRVGELYTSEFRLVAVDPSVYHALSRDRRSGSRLKD